MAEDGRSRLGRGLAALIGDVGEETKTAERARNQRRVPIEFVQPNPRNPRRNFSDAELDELAASIKRARHHPADRGAAESRGAGATRFRDHRRRAALARGAARRPASRCRSCRSTPPTARRSSSPSSRTCSAPTSIRSKRRWAIETLANEFDHTHDEIAKIVGKSRAHVTNTLRLLKLSEPIKAYIHSGKLTAGHARMLVGQPNAEELAEEIVERGLNVRQVEALARKDGKAQARGRKGKRRVGKDADTVALEKRVSDALGLKVSVDHRGRGRGAAHPVQRPRSVRRGAAEVGRQIGSIRAARRQIACHVFDLFSSNSACLAFSIICSARSR